MTTGNTYAPGNTGTAGTQHLANNLTLETGSVFSWDLTTASTTDGFDQVIGASGTTTFSAAGDFHIITNLASTDPFWKVQREWTTIFENFANLSGWTTAPAVSVFNTSNGARTDLASIGSFSVSGTTLTWNYTTVPEPCNAPAGLLLGAGLLRRRRK